MKFENYEIIHLIPNNKNKVFTYDDLRILEEDFKMLGKEDFDYER